jgi:hypothetical protein
VAYVLIGALARVIQGTDELTTGVDLVPQLKPDNVARLAAALADLEARTAAGRPRKLDLAPVAAGELATFRAPAGLVRVVPAPAGTRGGYDDLRRQATREPIGNCVRASVASAGDLARTAAAVGRGRDEPAIAQLRRLQELERGIAR